MLNYLAQCPEGVLLISHLGQQVSSQEIHSLKVANFGVSLEETVEDVTQLGVGSYFHLVICDVWVCPQHVQLNLLKVWVRIAHTMAVLELLIVAWMSLHLAQSTCSLEPDKRVNLVLPVHQLRKRGKQAAVAQECQNKDPLLEIEVAYTAGL